MIFANWRDGVCQARSSITSMALPMMRQRIRRNTAAFEECDLLPNVLRGVEQVDLSVVVMEQKLQVPFYCSPTGLQRLFHHQGERAVAHAAQKFGTMFGVSSLGTVSLEEISSNFSFPKFTNSISTKIGALTTQCLSEPRQRVCAL